MAEAIDHNTSSGVATAARGAGFGAIIGAVLAVAAVFTGVALLTAGATTFPWVGPYLQSAVGGTDFASTFAAFFKGGGPTWFAGVTSFFMGAVPALGLGAAIGGLFGLAKGADQVSQEKEAHRARAMGLTNSRQQKALQAKSTGELQGLQEGYQIGFADGEQAGAMKMQQMIQQQMMMMEQQAAQSQMAQAPAAHKETAGAAIAACKAEAVAKCEPCGDKTKALLEERAAAAAASAAGVVPAQRVG